MSRLVACPACSRHIRDSETKCPFCRGDVAAFLSRAPGRVLPTERLSRALLLTFTAASVGAAACGGETDDGKRQGLADAGGDAASGSGGDISVALYGAPAPSGAGGAGTGGEGEGGDLGAPEYGAPPPPAARR